MLYNAPTVSLRCTTLVILAVLVAAFVALYPYLGTLEMCDHGECPYMAQSSQTTSAGFVATCLSAVLVAPSVALALAMFHGRRLPTADPRPPEFCLSPDPPPPRSLLGL